jgi:hypothetical protein
MDMRDLFNDCPRVEKGNEQPGRGKGRYYIHKVKGNEGIYEICNYHMQINDVMH